MFPSIAWFPDSILFLENRTRPKARTQRWRAAPPNPGSDPGCFDPASLHRVSLDRGNPEPFGPISSSAGGFSLPELLLALAIAALVVVLSVPLLSLPQRSIQTAQLNQLSGFLNLTRSHAVNLGKRVTLCGSTDGRHCSANWSEQHSVLMFVDANNNRAADSGETLLLHDNSLGGRWHWRGSGLRSYMRFGPMGQAVDFGSFYLCPSRRGVGGRRVRINAAGRSYRDSVSHSELSSLSICR